MISHPPQMANSLREITNIKFVQFNALKHNPYTKKTTEMPTWLSADKVSAWLLAALIALVGIVYVGMKGDIDELKKDAKEVIRQSADTRVELVKAIGAVEKQAAITNARLDQLITDGRQRR